jgi:hypothetical protein
LAALGIKLGEMYTDAHDQSPLSTRLMARLAILKHRYMLKRRPNSGKTE